MALSVGRKKKQEEFQQLLRKKTASLAVCEGRHRIGKSREGLDFVLRQMDWALHLERGDLTWRAMKILRRLAPLHFPNGFVRRVGGDNTFSEARETQAVIALSGPAGKANRNRRP